MPHVSIRDFKKQKIENSMLNRDSMQNLSALKISNIGTLNRNWKKNLQQYF